MITAITHITLFVKEQEASLNFYKKIGFQVHTDAQFGPMRWLTLCLPNQKNLELAIIKAESAEELALVGKQSAIKPFISLESSDCRKDYEEFKALGIEFAEEPEEQPWGISAAFKDIDGNFIYMCQSL